MRSLSRAIAAGVFGGALLFAAPAEAGLVGAGRTVQAFYFNGVFTSPEGEIPVGGNSSDPTSLSAPVDYQQGVADESTIHIGDIQVVITNLLSGFPFCRLNTPGAACSDVIDGFDFKFTGENILGVSVDPSSASAFQSVTGTFQGNTHLGLQLLGANEIQVDVTGDLPLLNDQLILNLTFSTTPPPTNVPEPNSLALLGLGIAGLAAWRRKQ